MVIHPPVDAERFRPAAEVGSYYLMVSALVPYKRIDLAVEAFNCLNRPVKVVGGGPEEERLKKLAGPTVEFLGKRPDDELPHLYARCRALIFPGEEDFGIVPLEAQASGRPVIAYGKGGVLETVIPLNPPRIRSATGEQGHMVHGSGLPPPEEGPTGVFFYEQSVEALIEGVKLFEENAHRFKAARLRDHALRFDKAIFKAKIHALIDEKWREFQDSSGLRGRGSKSL